MDRATATCEISGGRPVPGPTPSQVANDLHAWARKLSQGRDRNTNVADLFQRAAATIDDLVATGTTRRNVWRLRERLSQYARWDRPWAASAGRAAGVLGRLWDARDRRAGAA